MLTIDSQIWIYYFDGNAKESSNITKWFEGENHDGVLFTKQIIMSSIIPIEVAHNLFKVAELDKDQIEQIIISFISLDNCQLIEIDQMLILEALKILKTFAPIGIGGRDALILATMEKFQLKTIVTLDKNLLALTELKRIDPVFKPPMLLEPEEDFNYEKFKTMIREQL